MPALKQRTDVDPPMGVGPAESCCMRAAQLVQVLPGVQSGIVTIVKDQAHGVMASWFNFGDHYILFPKLQRLLSRAMPAHLSRR